MIFHTIISCENNDDVYCIYFKWCFVIGFTGILCVFVFQNFHLFMIDQSSL